MKLASWTIALAVAALVAPVAATAQAVAPEPAPPAQQAAPPDKIGPPLHERQTPSATIKQPETTGDAPKQLAPSHGDAVSPAERNAEPPSR